MNRIFKVPLNVDDYNRARSLCLSRDDKADFSDGFSYGLSGGGHRQDMPPRFQDGQAVGFSAYQAAVEFQSKQAEKGRASAAARSTMVQPNVNHGSTTVQPRFDPCSNLSSNPVIHKSKDPESVIDKPPPQPPRGEKYDDDFERWWEIYRRKGNKIQSGRQWERLTPEEKAEAIDRTPIYVNGREKKYQKDGERFLRDRHWQNEHVQDIQPPDDPYGGRMPTLLPPELEDKSP